MYSKLCHLPQIKRSDHISHESNAVPALRPPTPSFGGFPTVWVVRLCMIFSFLRTPSLSTNSCIMPKANEASGRPIWMNAGV